MDYLACYGGETMTVAAMGLYRYKQEDVNRLREDCPTDFGDTAHSPNAVSFQFALKEYQTNRGIGFGIDLFPDGYWVFWISLPEQSDVHQPYGVLRMDDNMKLYAYTVKPTYVGEFQIGFFNKTPQEMKQDHPGLAEAGSELYDGIIQYFNGVIDMAKFQPKEQYIEVYDEMVEGVIRYHKKLVGGFIHYSKAPIVGKLEHKKYSKAPIGGKKWAAGAKKIQFFTNAKCMLDKTHSAQGKKVKIEFGTDAGDDKFFRSAFKGVSSRC
jgi:hypothetical protein